jgi:peptidoglycan LD-endopeptidase LytH
VGHALWHLVDVVRDKDERRTIVVCSQVTEGGDELLAAPEIEPRRGFVEQDDVGLVHQRSREQDPLLLAGRQRRQRPLCEPADVHAVETGEGALAIGVRVSVPPGLERGVLGGHHDVARRERRTELAGERRRRVADAAAELTDIGTTERLTEHPNDAGRRVLVHRGDPQERRLATAVRAEHEPSLVGANVQREVVEDSPAVAYEHDRVEFERGRADGHGCCVAGGKATGDARNRTATRDSLAYAMRSAVQRTLMLLATGAMLLVFAAPAVAQTDDDAAERAAQEIAAARERANQAAEDYFAAESQLELLELQQERLVLELANQIDLVAELRRAVEYVAVSRFVSSGASGIPILTDLRKPTEQLHGDVLANVVAESGATTLDDYDAALDVLDAKQLELDEAEVAVVHQQGELLRLQSDAEAEVVQLREIESQRLKDEDVRIALAAKQRQDDRQLEELQRRQAEAQRASAATPGSGATVSASSSNGTTAGNLGASGGEAGGRTGGGGAGTNPRAAGDGYLDTIICPVQGGSAYGNTWGAPRSGGRRHQGVDMLAPTGTPLQAVVSGMVTQAPNNRLGGLTVSVHGDNGNRYYYGHLSAYEGEPRRVEQGEVIGYVGDSGNAQGTPHLHFEIHPGGGVAVNPYPSVRAAGC